MKNVIVTGANCFLGVELVTKLVKAGVSVHAIHRPESNTARLIERAPIVNLHEYDGSQNSLSEILAATQPDIVFHLAGKYIRDEISSDIPKLIAANITFGSQLLEASRCAGVKGFINTGSYFQFCNTLGSPVNFYAAAKNAFAEILGYYSGLGVFKTTSLILFDIYGPGDWRKKLIPVIRAAQKNNTYVPLAEENTPLYPVYVTDAVDCYIQAAQFLIEDPDKIHAKYFAVRGPKSCSISDIVATFEMVGGKPIAIKKGNWPKPANEIKRVWRGNTLPDWEIQYALVDGIRMVMNPCP